MAYFLVVVSYSEMVTPHTIWNWFGFFIKAGQSIAIQVLGSSLCTLLRLLGKLLLLLEIFNLKMTAQKPAIILYLVAHHACTRQSQYNAISCTGYDHVTSENMWL